MKIFLKTLGTLVLVIAALVLASVPAQAYTISFDYQGAGDGSGKTSPYVSAANTAQNGFYIETFDVPGTYNAATGKYDPPSDADYIAWSGVGNVVIQPGYVDGYGSGLYSTYAGGYGGFSSLSSVNDFKVTLGSIGIRNGGVGGVAANPAGDNTFFAYAPAQGQDDTVTVKVDYTYEQSQGANLNYLGLYYGSIDTYNWISFYDANDKLITTITGTDILTKLSGPAGSWIDDRSNVYVNMFFTPNENWTYFTLNTNGVAVEVDNISVGHVPEPATMLLLGLGLVGLAGMRRKLQK